ncbi:MAG: metallophosphoesterase [Polyangiaceae bacterium]|nr:metallophosphoesterase [Polyangiaceae bacterium]
MKLFAISDLHVGYSENREALAQMTPHPSDWLILAGDVGETEDHLRFALATLSPKFERLIWVPGNHELYVLPEAEMPRGEAKYRRLCRICQDFDVLTPEDPYEVWTGEGGPHVLAPMFLLYDYSFRPPEVPEEEAVFWAMESGIVCSDERLLDPHPHASRSAWCAARVRETEARLTAAPALPKVLINHYPLREELVRLRKIPRFSIWCGTKQTHDWHLRFHASVVVSGHLHIPRTDHIDGVRFEEVSLGYPRQRPPERHVDTYVRQILPARE